MQQAALAVAVVCAILAVVRGARLLEPPRIGESVYVEEGLPVSVAGTGLVKLAPRDGDGGEGQEGAGGSRMPVVLWHGMGDTCCNSDSLGGFADWLSSHLNGGEVWSVRLGATESADQTAGYFANMPDAVGQVCQAIAGEPSLAAGFYGLGFSQGAQFLRAVAESCGGSGPRMLRLVSLGGQHRGVSQVPHCNSDAQDAAYCERMQALVSHGAYLPWVRDHVVQAQYYRDPAHLDAYLSHNPFLPLVNNEDPASQDPSRAAALASLEALVLVMFEQDTMVVPRESSLFGEEQEDGTVLPLRQTELYQEDWLGLKKLDGMGRLHLLSKPGDHLDIDAQWFEDHLLPFLM